MVIDHDASVKLVTPRLPVILLPLRVYIKDAASTDVVVRVNAAKAATAAGIDPSAAALSVKDGLMKRRVDLLFCLGVVMMSGSGLGGCFSGILLGVCFLREAPERAVGLDKRAGKWGF
jgi:hypothetical protein